MTVKIKRVIYLIIVVMLSISVISCGNNNDGITGDSTIVTVSKEDTLGEGKTPEGTKKPDSEKITQSTDLDREEGYNTIEVLFSLFNEKALPMDVDVFSVYSSTEAFYTIEEAIDAEVIKDYSNKDGRLTLLLKDGFTFNASMNPSDTSEVKGWEQYKGNYPFELMATTEGTNRLTRFKIAFNYATDTVSTKVETFEFN